jgi:hypothetical protein
MPAKTPDEILGLEYDWLEAVSDGHVGLFTTAGGGFAPDAFLEDTDAYDEAIQSLLTLPPHSEVAFAPTVGAGCVNTWKQMAERGVYAFDSSVFGDPYKRVAGPRHAVKLADLPAAIADVAGRVRLIGCFGEPGSVDPARLRPVV